MGLPGPRMPAQPAQGPSGAADLLCLMLGMLLARSIRRSSHRTAYHHRRPARLNHIGWVVTAYLLAVLS